MYDVVLCHYRDSEGVSWDWCVCVYDGQPHLDEELLVAGPPPPSKLASPGPARAPRPPWTNAKQSKPVQIPGGLGSTNEKIINGAAHLVLPVLLVPWAASAGCGSYFPEGFAGPPLLPVQRVHVHCHLHCLVLRVWEDCLGTHWPYDSTHHPCPSLAPDGNYKSQKSLKSQKMAPSMQFKQTDITQVWLKL